MPALHLTYLNRPDVEALALTDDEILGAVESGLRAQGLGQTVIEPRVHLRPDERFAAISTSCAGTSRRSAWPASRWWATTSTTTSSGCPPKMAC